MDNFGKNRVREVLDALGISQVKLARGIDTTSKHINAICTNRNQPSVKTLYQIADFLQIDARELLHYNGHPSLKEKVIEKYIKSD